MSWKIYDGFILKHRTSMEDAFSYFQTLVPDFITAADEHWKQIVISHAIAEFDNDYAQGIQSRKDYIGNSEMIFWKEASEAALKGQRSFTDTAVIVSFVPVKIRGKNRIIGMLFCDNRVLKEKFFGIDDLAEYAYFNNTDRPDEISAAEWKSRAKVWEKVFEKFPTPNKAMVGYDIIGNKELRHPSYTEEDVQKYSLPFEDRVKGAVNDRILKNKSFSNLQTYTEFMRSEEAMKARELITPIVTERLKQTVGLFDLLGEN